MQEKKKSPLGKGKTPSATYHLKTSKHYNNREQSRERNLTTGERKLITGTKKTQLQLSQQRIQDYLLKESDKGNVLRVDGNLTADEDYTTIDESDSGSEDKSIKGTPPTQFLDLYGSDYDTAGSRISSCINNNSQATGVNGSCSPDALKESTLAISDQSTLQPKQKTMANLTKSELKEVWREILGEMKEEMKNDWKETMDSLSAEIRTEVDSMNEMKKQIQNENSKLVQLRDDTKDDMKKAKVDLQVCQLQLKEVIGVVIRQDQMLQECKDTIEDLKSYKDRKLLRIAGITESSEENCAELVKKFFKDKLEIEKEIKTLDAFRVGSGKNRAI